MAQQAVAQAAAVPYRRSPFGAVEVLLVSRRSGGWGIPKGRIEAGHDAPHTAFLEAFEEAGILGQVDQPALGSYGFRKRGRKHEVRVFALAVERVLERWQEDHRRVRVWIPIAEAGRLLERPALERCLTRLRHRLLTGGGALKRAA